MTKTAMTMMMHRLRTWMISLPSSMPPPRERPIPARNPTCHPSQHRMPPQLQQTLHHRPPPRPQRQRPNSRDGSTPFRCVPPRWSPNSTVTSSAKRAVAIAMRNRWRRRQLPPALLKEVTPRNVLMIGPTGCGKTEVARRMAALGDAPFLKVEATKFTEVGYHGRDVDQIVRDLMDVSMQLTKKRQTDKMRGQAEEITEERILDILAGPTSTSKSSRESFHEMLRDGILDSHEVEVEVPIESDKSGMFSVGGSDNNPNVVAVTDFLSRVASGRNNRGGAQTERKKMTVKEARQVILDIELERLLENIDLKKEAIASVEESGIVFIDEIDKICSSRDYLQKSADASAEGVQRDLLPLIEGTTISTKYGNVNTDYILFIASGAFHAVKPSDMLPELQGRLPIRVELNGLTEDDLYKILTEPVANLLHQQR